MFYDRNEAGIELADRLVAYTGKNALVLAIPRGAVPIAKIISDKIKGDLDVVLVHKLRAPFSSELAIGAVDESGELFISEYADMFGVDNEYIQNEKNYQLDTIRQRRSQYSPICSQIDPKGRVVIVVDDGLATGFTMIAALNSLRKRGAAKLICAVPVSPPDTLKKIAQLADEVVCLETPANFQSVGQFYSNFPQVDDEEVIEMLQSSNYVSNTL